MAKTDAMCPHPEPKCRDGLCPVLLAPLDALRIVAALRPLPGTLAESAKGYAIDELARRERLEAE